MGDIYNPKHGSVMAIGPFTVANLDTNLTNTDLLLVGAAGVTLAPSMPAPGAVLGVSASSNAQPSAGSATFSVHSGGTELVNGPTAVIDSSNSDNSEGEVSSASEHTFAQGARLGISATTTTDLAATTVEYAALIWVRLDPFG